MDLRVYFKGSIREVIEAILDLSICKNNHCHSLALARIFHESLATTTDMAVLPGVLGCRPLRRTVQVRLETNTLRLPGGTPIFEVSRQQFMKYAG